MREADLLREVHGDAHRLPSDKEIICENGVENSDFLPYTEFCMSKCLLLGRIRFSDPDLSMDQASGSELFCTAGIGIPLRLRSAMRA